MDRNIEKQDNGAQVWGRQELLFGIKKAEAGLEVYSS